MATQVLVPPLGQTVDTLSFVSWLKQEGELVQQGEALYVVETDKAMLDVEAPATGILSQVTAQKGDQVKVLAPIAVILAEGERLGETDLEREDATRVRTAADEGPTRVRTGHEARRLEGIPPAGSDGRRFVSPRARRLAADESVPLEQLDASGPERAIVERDVRSYLAERDAARAHASDVAASAPQAEAQGPASPAVSPLARRLAEEEGVDLASVAGTGPRGQITREDVEAAAVRGAGARAPEAAESKAPASIATSQRQPLEVIPLSGVRGVVAQRMAASSQQTAPVTLTAEADATTLVQLRERLIADGIPVSYNDLLLCALGKALRQHPRLNASLDGDRINVWPQVDVGLAVDAERGLLVPVMRDVDRKGLAQLAAESKALAERARAGLCTQDELKGGTFTLTNLGMFGIDAFTPIINLPECAILGVGRIKTEPAWVGDHVEPRERVWLSLTFDHRLVDGGPAARFLQTVVRLVEKPHLLMA